jgi:hypothetical protein
MVLVCWWPRWCPRVSQLSWKCAMKSSVLVNCPWGSARSCRMAPVHFRLPIGGPMSGLYVRAPLPVPRGPPAEGPACCEVELPSQWTAVGLSTLQLWGPRWLSTAIYSPVLRCARAGPKAAAVKDEGVGLPGKLSRGQHTVILLPDPCHAACENLSAHVQHKVTSQFPPTSSCCAQRQPEWSHCRLRSSLLIGHPSASTADSLLLLNITGVNRTCVSQRIPIAYRENADISKFN